MEDSADNERRPAQSTTQSTTQYTTQKLTEAQNMILSYLREHPEATRADLNSHIEGITVDGIKYNLARLQELGLLKRVGFPYTNRVTCWFTAYYSCRTNTHDGILLCPKCREFFERCQISIRFESFWYSLQPFFSFCCSD